MKSSVHGLLFLLLWLLIPRPAVAGFDFPLPAIFEQGSPSCQAPVKHPVQETWAAAKREADALNAMREEEEKAAEEEKKAAEAHKMNRADYLMIFAFIVVVIGGLMFLVAAFRAGMFWGIAIIASNIVANRVSGTASLVCLLFPLVFLVMHWHAAKMAFFAQLIGFVLLFASFSMGPGSAFGHQLAVHFGARPPDPAATQEGDPASGAFDPRSIRAAAAASKNKSREKAVAVEENMARIEADYVAPGSSTPPPAEPPLPAVDRDILARYEKGRASLLDVRKYARELKENRRTFVRAVVATSEKKAREEIAAVEKTIADAEEKLRWSDAQLKSLAPGQAPSAIRDDLTRDVRFEQLRLKNVQKAAQAREVDLDGLKQEFQSDLQ